MLVACSSSLVALVATHMSLTLHLSPEGCAIAKHSSVVALVSHGAGM